MIVDNMLKEVRVNAGLGNPPSPFFTNVPESANALIKRAVGFKESGMSDFVAKISEVIRQQQKDVRDSIINKGPYTLTSAFSDFSVVQDKWFKMSVQQRERHMKKFEKKQDPNPNPNQCTEENNEPAYKLSLKAEDVQLPSIPGEVLKRIFIKANNLLQSKENAMVPTPGNDRFSYLVESETSKRPHYVYSEQQTGKTVCDNCPGWASSNLCAHSVAVAEKLNKLEAYINWVRRRDKSMNMTTMVTFDTSKGVGRKGNKASTSRRKGGRTANHDTGSITEVDRLARYAEQNTPQNTTAQQPFQYYQQTTRLHLNTQHTTAQQPLQHNQQTTRLHPNTQHTTAQQPLQHNQQTTRLHPNTQHTTAQQQVQHNQQTTRLYPNTQHTTTQQPLQHNQQTTRLHPNTQHTTAQQPVQHNQQTTQLYPNTQYTTTQQPLQHNQQTTRLYPNTQHTITQQPLQHNQQTTRLYPNIQHTTAQQSHHHSLQTHIANMYQNNLASQCTPQQLHQQIPPVNPSPSIGTYILYLLQYCPPQTKKCYGCGKLLKPGGKIGEPPNDMVVVSCDKRKFIGSNNQTMEKVGNVYYHVIEECLKAQQPYFVPSLIQVPSNIKCELRNSHIDRLRSFGVVC